jgi:hypothetical protein
LLENEPTAVPRTLLWQHLGNERRVHDEIQNALAMAVGNGLLQHVERKIRQLGEP